MFGDAGASSIIHDFDSQLQFYINRHTGACNRSSLSEPYVRDVTFDIDGNPQLLPPSRFFFLGGDYNYSYEGVTTVRGVEVDSWVAIVDFVVLGPFSNMSDGVIDIFFTRPEYNITTDRSTGGSQVPWRIILRGLVTYDFFNITGSMNTSFEIDYFDFSPSEPSYDAFDISSCSDPDQSHTLGLRFKVPRDGIDFSTFRTNLRASLVAATNLKPLQVNNIHVSLSPVTCIFMTPHDRITCGTRYC
jgi:hypothetical protein